jgi:hypothetical protein
MPRIDPRVGVVWRGAAAARRSSPDTAADQIADPGADFVEELAVGAVVGLGCGIVGGVPALDLIHGSGQRSTLVARFSVLGVFFGAVVTDMLWRQFVSRR